MKLTYWKACHLFDSDFYSIRAKTKKEALANIEAYGAESFGKPFKVTVEYQDAFDLMKEMSCEDHHWFEQRAEDAAEVKADLKKGILPTPPQPFARS